MKAYYTLAARDSEVDLWTPQFGDYDKSVVEDELTGYAESGAWRRKNMKIIRTADDQPAIEAGVRRLNYPNSVRSF